MKRAIVTGASSGIGGSLAQALWAAGYEVIGFGRNFEEIPEREDFTQVALDLLDTDSLLEAVDQFRAKGDVDLLALCAGCAYYGPHETLNPRKIAEMVRVNLEVPLILVQHLLRDLRRSRGTIVLMSSVTAEFPSPQGAAYGATKAGLSAFGQSLFEEVRKSGVKVLTVQPDLTDTKLYRHADFAPDPDPMACLNPKEVADAVLYALSCPDHMVLREITLRPQLNRIVRRPLDREPF